jgi:hypothetical protein
VDTCLHEKRKAKTVEAVPPGSLAKSVELPHSPINTPSVEIRTHTHHYLEISHAKLSFLV